MRTRCAGEWVHLGGSYASSIPIISLGGAIAPAAAKSKLDGRQRQGRHVPTRPDRAELILSGQANRQERIRGRSLYSAQQRNMTILSLRTISGND